MKHVCAICEETIPAEDLDLIDDIETRVPPGEPMPSGECPDCQGFCYPHPETGQEKLDAASIAQTAYWDAIHALEEDFDYELDMGAVGELSGYTYEQLKAEHSK